MYQPGKIAIVPAVIAAAGTKSAAVNLNEATLVGMHVPDIVGTAITFEASETLAGTYRPVVKQDGTAVSYVVADNKYAAVDPKDFYGVKFLKVVSGSTETGGATINLAVRSM